MPATFPALSTSRVHGFTVPPQIAAAFRALGALEGTLLVLNPGMDIIVAARSAGQDYVGHRLGAAQVRATLEEHLVHVVPILQRLPRLQRHHEPRQEGLGERADEQGVGDGRDAEHPAEREADEHDHDLDPRAHQPERQPGAARQPGHQAVPRAGAELGADVHRRRDPVEDQPGDHQRDPAGPALRGVDPGHHRVDDQADEDGVGDRAEAGRLPQWHPQEQHDHRGRDDHLAEGERHVPGHALVQDVPGHHAESALDQQHHRHPVEHEPQHELRDAQGEAPRAQLPDRAEVGQAAARVGGPGAGPVGGHGHSVHDHYCRPDRTRTP